MILGNIRIPISDTNNPIHTAIVPLDGGREL